MPSVPLIVAHRGASYDAPENTLAAFRLGFQQGADAIEGDFRLTKDGHVVCAHDARTKRVGDRDLEVEKSTLAQLQKIDIGTWKSPTFAKERVATLADVLAVVPRGKRAFLELKTGPQIVPAVKQIIEAGPVPLAKLSIISFNADTVLACREAMPKITANWLAYYKKDDCGRRTPTPAMILETLKRCRAHGLGTEAKPAAITPALIKGLKDAGLGLHVWTVDTPRLAQAFIDRGVQSITTNRPAWLRERL